jgi:hypothetical protein
MIEETDLYLRGIQFGDVEFYSKLINLIQQNKHLHCISLTDKEGEVIFGTLQELGTPCDSAAQKMLEQMEVEVNREFIWQKNKLDKKYQFASESDLEAYMLMSLKSRNNHEYRALDEILVNWSGSSLANSTIYNQFIFGNAYPADIVIVNDNSINVFELKRDRLTNSISSQIEKEIRKHLYYSLFSERISQEKSFDVFNFYLLYLCEGDETTKNSMLNMYQALEKKIIKYARKNNLIFLEYKLQDDRLSLFQT